MQRNMQLENGHQVICTVTLVILLLKIKIRFFFSKQFTIFLATVFRVLFGYTFTAIQALQICGFGPRP